MSVSIGSAASDGTRIGRNVGRADVCSVSKRHLHGSPFRLGRDHPIVSHSPERPARGGGTVAAKKLPIENQVLKLLGDGLGDREIAEKVGTTPNHPTLPRRIDPMECDEDGL